MQYQCILVVCVGNICRSPMAEEFLKHETVGLNIYSAGISAMIGHPAELHAQSAMQNLYGLNIEQHVAQQLNIELINTAQLILVMSRNQQQHVCKTWPSATGKTFRLGHWRDTDISDPYGLDQAEFNDCCVKIQHCVKDWIKHIY